MARVTVSTPRTTLLILILIVGCGLILSLIRMSKIPSSSFSSGRHYITSIINEAANSQKVRFESDGPTIFKDDTVIKLYEEEQKSRHNLPQLTEPTADQGSAAREPGPADKTSTSSPPSVVADTPGVPTLKAETVLEQPETEQETPTETEASTEKSTQISTEKSTEPESQAKGPTIVATQSPSHIIPNEPAPNTRPVHILLLTEGRSGSTWLSSFFWHRKDVYYTFEPLFQTPSWKKHGCSNTLEERKECDKEVLSNFWNCDFHTSELSVLGRYSTYHLNCSIPKLCTTEGKETACNAATHRVAKTIRLWDLKNIEDIMKKTEEYDVRVIHMVRDPRPLIKSRSKGGFGSLDGIHKHNDYGDEVLEGEDESFEEQCATVCNRMLEQSQLGDNPPDWLKDRYVRVSHERMSLHPIETAMMLYKFVGLSWTPDTQYYIYNTTVGEIGKGGMFGIGKVSTKVINAWKMMKESLIQQITDACYDAINYLGYETDMEKIRQWREDNAELFADDDSNDDSNDTNDDTNDSNDSSINTENR